MGRLLLKCVSSCLTSFLVALVNDVWIKVIHFMDLLDIVRCFAVSWLFSTLGREVINSRLNYILTHTVGDANKQLRAILDSTNSVLLGSLALDILLYGTSPIRQHELRIATPNYAKHIIATFFDELGFTRDTSLTFYTPSSTVAVYDHNYIQKAERKVALINSPTDSIMPIALAHRSSTDCMFISTGGLFCGYPELLNDQVTFLPVTHPRSSSARYFSEREYRVVTRNDPWTLPCVKKCPTLWRRMDEGLFVTWHGGLTPSEVTKQQDLQWRLTSHCANFACWNNIFKDPDPYSGACSVRSIDLRISELISRNVSAIATLFCTPCMSTKN